MCGIAGMFVPGADSAELQRRVRAAASRIAHRGPDDEGYYAQEGLALGHRRLVVIDRTGGAQPFTDSGGRVTAAYNGEIYNHRELRQELASEGETFTTRSDTEVLVRAFARRGTDAFIKLDGMFAAALWKHAGRSLFLVRDPAGEKPLFFSENPLGPGSPGIAFASEVYSLLALLSEVPPVDPAGLWSYLTLGYAREPRILKGIRLVPPGSWLRIENGRITDQQRYWRPRFTPVHLPEREALPCIRRAMKLAVQSRLEADVPLGAFLSGGVDSSIIVYEMRQAGVDEINTFSIGFREGEGYDESPWAREVGRLLNTHHHEQMFGVSEAIVESTLNALDEPMADSSAIATWSLAEHARRHITVALGGDGGDEVFCGYERFAGILLTERIPLAVRRLLSPLAPLVPDTGGYGNRGDRLRRLLRDGIHPAAERLLRWQAMQPPEQARRYMTEQSGFASPFPWPAGSTPGSGSVIHDMLAANFESYLPDDLLVKTDRMTMNHGLELRSPFLAKDVIETGLTLPADGLARGLALKRWLKKAYEGFLPNPVLHRRKHGFGVPIHKWLRGVLQEWAAARLFDRQSPLHDHVDSDAVRLLWKTHMDGRDGGQQVIWALIVLDHWLRRIRS